MDQHTEAKIVSEFSKMLSSLTNTNTLRLLKLMVDGQLEVLSNISEVESPEGKAPITIEISATPYRPKVKTLAAGTLLDLSSDTETSTDSPSPVKYPSPFVSVVRDLIIEDDMVQAVSQESFGMTSQWKGSSKACYSWLNFHNIPYKFGNTTHQAKDRKAYPNIRALMDTINTHLDNPGLDSCLITYYDNGHIDLPLHSDDESHTIDQSCPIVIFSLGSPRTIKFCTRNLLVSI